MMIYFLASIPLHRSIFFVVSSLAHRSEKCSSIPLQLLFNPLPLRGSQPGGFARPICQEEEGNGAQQDCWNSFQEKQPAPTLHGKPVVTQNPAGEWGSENKRQRNGAHEITRRFGALLPNKPVAQIDNHTREKTGFCGA